MVRLRVREIAEEQGLNISQLHQRANQLTPGASLAYTTVLGLWYNRTKRPDLDSLAAVARALGVEPGELIVKSVSEEDREQKKLAPESAVLAA